MTCEEALAILGAHRDELQAMGLRRVSIFGSVARNEATDESDVDVLVELDRPMGLFGFVRLQHKLEVWLGRSVDLATADGLRPAVRESVLREARHGA
jgi:predicted nucleotidyltransferase